jgi:hypothetical protein
MRSILIFAAGMLIVVSNAVASKSTYYGFFTGVELHEACGAANLSKHTSSDIRGALRKEGECRGYIIGIADVLGSGVRIDSFRSCLPPRTTDQQVIDAVVYWLGKNLKFRQRAGPSLVAEALATSFPCK